MCTKLSDPFMGQFVITSAKKRDADGKLHLQLSSPTRGVKGIQSKQLRINWGSTEDQLRQVTKETTFFISLKARPVPTQRALAASQPRRPLARGSLSSCERIDNMINPFQTEFDVHIFTNMAACSY